MPKVTLVSENAPILLPMQGRSPGLHVSTLIHELAVGMGHYKESDEEINQAQFEMGNALEWAMIERMVADKPYDYTRGFEIEFDGLFGSPDLLQPVIRADHEFKCSKMSAKNGPGSEKFWKYECQLKAYLHMLGWNTGFLHVLYVNGGYEWVRGGPYRWLTWRYDFTANELAANWRALKQQERDRAA